MSIPSPLVDVAEHLWPGAQLELAVGRSGSSDAGHEDYLPLPPRGAPRLLVPLETPAAAATGIAGSSTGGSANVQRLRRGLARAVAGTVRARLPVPRLRVTPATSPSATLRGRLGEVVDDPSCVLGVRLGTPRANQKPVLQVLARDGRQLAFAKVGHPPLADRLADHEATVLGRLDHARLSVLRPPVVLGHLVAGEARILVLEPLPVPDRPIAPDALLGPALRELGAQGDVGHPRIGDADHLADLRRRSAELGVAGADALGDALDDLADRHRDQRLAHGAGHGDFRPWNVAVHDGRLLAWDWERGASRVPRGLDAVHYHHVSPRADEPTTDYLGRVAGARRRAAPLLHDVGIAGEHHELVTTLHLAHVALRQLDDLAVGATAPRLRRSTDQLVRAVCQSVAR